MGSIITLDNLDNESELAPTAANFPSLKHFFDAETLALTDTSWTDSVGGVVVPMGTVSAGDDDYSRSVVSNPVVDAAITGNWVQPGTTPVVMLGMGTHANQGWIIGSSGASNISDAIRLVSIAGAGGIFDDSVGTADIFDNLTAATSMIATAFDVGGNINSYEYDGTVLDTANTGNATTNATTLDAIGDVAGFNATKHYGVAIFHFANLPSDGDMRSAIAWMYERWIVGEKVIWPGWKGRS